MAESHSSSSAPRRHRTLVKAMFYTLFAVALTFCAETLVFMNFLYGSGVESAKDMVLSYKDRVAFSIKDALADAVNQVRYMGEMLGATDVSSGKSLSDADRALRNIFRVNRNLYCSWYVLADAENPERIAAAKAYVNADGIVGEFSDTAFLARPMNEAWYSRPLTSGRQFIGTVRFAPSVPGGDPVYTAVVSAPLFDASGKAVGVCGANIKYKSVVEIIYKFDKKEQNRVFLLGGDMAILYAPGGGAVAMNTRDRNLRDFPFLDKSKKRDLYDEMLETLRRDGVYWREMNGPFIGVPAFVSIHTITLDVAEGLHAEPLHLFMGTKLEALYAKADKRLRMILGITAAFIVIISLMVYANINAIARPIKKLTGDALKISKGDYGVVFDKVAEGDMSEVAVLGRSLTDMMDALRETLREAHEAKMRAVEASRGKTQFLTDMSHEIRTPMNAIVGMSAMAKKATTLERKDYCVAKIQEASKRLLGIVNGILDISQIEAGKFTFPRADSRAGGAETPAGGDGAYDIKGIFAGYCVLIADDLEINIEIMINLLEPTGIAIESALDGAEAVKMFSESPDSYDLILMDVQMPGVDGLEAARRIRKLNVPRAQTVPIVAMTAHVFKEDVDACVAAGMNDHIGKPIDMDEIVRKLNWYLRGVARGI